MSDIPLVVLVVGIAVGAALVARVGARWYFERFNAARFTRSSNGIVEGAEAVELEGDGQAGLLLLHGFGDTPQSMRDLAHELHGAGYGIIVPLLPGHGRNLRGFVQSTSTEWITHAASALEHLRQRYSEVAVIGQSMGGALATILAANSDVTTVVLIAPYLSVPRTVRRIATWRHVIDHLLPYFPGLGRGSIHDASASAASLAYGALNARILAELVMLGDKAFAMLPALRIPVLMIQSREDNRIPVDAAERIFRQLGSEEKHIVWLTGCGHVLTVDHGRADVAREVRTWLARYLPVSRSTGR